MKDYLGTGAGYAFSALIAGLAYSSRMIDAVHGPFYWIFLAQGICAVWQSFLPTHFVLPLPSAIRRVFDLAEEPISRSASKSELYRSEGLSLVVILRLTLVSTVPITFWDNLVLGLVWPSSAMGCGLAIFLNYLCFIENSDTGLFFQSNKFTIRFVFLVVLVARRVTRSAWLISRGDSDVIAILLGFSVVCVSWYETESDKRMAWLSIFSHLSSNRELKFACYSVMIVPTLALFAQAFSDIALKLDSAFLTATGIAAVFCMPYSQDLSAYVLLMSKNLLLAIEWMFGEVLIQNNAVRMWICLAWIVCILCAIPISCYAQSKLQVIAARKIFHFIAVIMFAPVTSAYPDFMVMGYSVALCALLAIELVRLLAHQWSSKSMISKILNQVSEFYSKFLDQRDSLQGMIMSHIHLLMGCAIPLFYSLIVPSWSTLRPWRLVKHFGWVSVGIGDAVGALVGISFGRTRWPGSRKTIEGTFAAIFSMSIALVMIIVIEDRKYLSLKALTEWDESSMNELGLGIVTMTGVGLAEAITSENDNLIMPLVACVVHWLLVSFNHR